MVAIAALLTLTEVVLVLAVIIGAVGFFALIAWDLIAGRERPATPEPQGAYKPGPVHAV